jgi:Trk K+ transport system NAD-binding subunit
MLFGAAALAILFALVTDVLVSARLARVLGGLPRQLRDHVIVCGAGNIGYRVVEHLIDLEVPVVAAELEEANRFLPAMRRLGVPVLIADIRLTETLQALHVGQARSLVVVTSSDVVNLETALNANELNPDLRVVLRLFDPDLAARVERAFGIYISRSPSALAAPAFAAAAEGERVIATISVGIPVLLVARVQVDAGCKAEGGTIAELESATRSRTLLLTSDDGPSWCPPGHIVLRAGQELVMVATQSGLAQLLASTQVDLAEGARNRDQEASRPSGGPSRRGLDT